MDVTNLRKINEGTSGSVAADIIYGNDRKLCQAIDECSRELEANRILAAQANNIEGRPNVTIVQSTGTGSTAVMSQAAVSQQLNNIDSQLSGVCMVGEENVEVINFSGAVMTNANIANMAATDLSGRSISASIDTFLAYIETANATIEDLTARIEALEEELEKKK